MHIELCLWRQVSEPGDCFFKPETAVRINRVNRAELDCSDDIPFCRPDRPAEVFNRAEQIKHGAVHLFSLFREAKTTAPAMTNSDAQSGFQCRHVIGNRGG